MNLSVIFNLIENQYTTLNNEYTNKFNRAIQRQSKSYKSWQHKKEMNDAIHFLFIFTRFESFLREKSEQLLVQKSISNIYSRKGGWLILKEQSSGGPSKRERLQFKERIQLFIDKGRAENQKLNAYYDIRNSLAHGGTFNTPIDVIKAKNELLQRSRLIR